ncbi:plasmid mobilization protein [Wenzhouxiangella sp. EGI_FJ10409]|uniref:plasmid mobilization protein n=1 Tax=Wenzhouxiangella sp. EGI_FJ10409 TaxID=3243767 RepID=UPI0035D65038
MARLCCYLPDEEAEALRSRAERAGMSVSRYLAELARRDGLTHWPKGYFERVFGGDVEPIERGPQGEFERRAGLE